MIKVSKICIFYFLSIKEFFILSLQLKDFRRTKSRKLIILVGSSKRFDTLTYSSKSIFYFCKEYSIIFLKKYSIFYKFFMLFIIKLLKYKNFKIIKIISDEIEKKGIWDFSLEWNNHHGIKGKRNKTIFTVDDVTVGEKDQPLKLILPIINYQNIKRDEKQSLHPIYIGIMGGMNIKKATLKEANAKSVKIDKTDFEISEDINLFIYKRWLSRLFFVKELKNKYGDWFELRGIGWNKFNFNYKLIGYEKKVINQRYLNAGICLDFLSQNSNNCIYERSINILNSGGILVQRKSYNSEEVFGKRFVEKYSFSNIDELFKKIEEISKRGYKESSKDMKIAIKKATEYQYKKNRICIKKCFKLKDKNFN